MEWQSLKARTPQSCQAVVAAIDQLDLCPQRADRMHHAHRQVEEEQGQRTLTLAMLTKWHATACPDDGPREEPWAWAKGGGERYSLDNDLLDRRLQSLGQPFASCLRAYLDILFFHPFSDGNSRAARLAFHFLASRDGLQFRIADPLFRLSLPAGSLPSYRLFQNLARRCLGTPGGYLP